MGAQQTWVENPGKGRACEECGEPIGQSTTGRRRRTCSDACRQSRYRRERDRRVAREAVAAALAIRGLVDDATVVTSGPGRDGHITADRSGTDRIDAGPVRDGRPRPLPEDQPLW